MQILPILLLLFAILACKQRNSDNSSSEKSLNEVVDIIKVNPDGSREVVCKYPNGEPQQEHVSAAAWNAGAVCKKNSIVKVNFQYKLEQNEFKKNIAATASKNLQGFLSSEYAAICDQVPTLDYSLWLNGHNNNIKSVYTYNISNGLTQLFNSENKAIAHLNRVTNNKNGSNNSLAGGNTYLISAGPGDFNLGDLLIAQLKDSNLYMIIGWSYYGGFESIADASIFVLKISGGPPSCNRGN